MNMRTILRLLGVLSLSCFAGAALAADVAVLDPGFNAAIRAALNKPAGPLTDQDMLTLTSLNAFNRNITNLQGLEAAANLTALNLRSNRLVNISLPPTLKDLFALDLNGNQITNITLPP